MGGTSTTQQQQTSSTTPYAATQPALNSLISQLTGQLLPGSPDGAVRRQRRRPGPFDSVVISANGAVSTSCGGAGAAVPAPVSADVMEIGSKSQVSAFPVEVHGRGEPWPRAAPP